MLRRKAISDATRVDSWRVASALLRYPDDELMAALPAIRSAVIDAKIPHYEQVVALIDDWLSRDVIDLQSEYVEVFDLGRHNSLYTTWHQYGESRERGIALLKMKRTFQKHGMSPIEDELPDWLPLMLEFAATAPAPAGVNLLEDWRAPIELVRGSLHENDRQQAVLLDLVSSTLSKLGSNVVEAVAKLLEEGPPTEEVGLEPFGPGNEMPSATLPAAEQYVPTGGPNE